MTHYAGQTQLTSVDNSCQNTVFPMSCITVTCQPISLCYIIQNQLNATFSGITESGRAAKTDG